MISSCITQSNPISVYTNSMAEDMKVSCSKDAKPHIVFLPSPEMGHITPIFEFAKNMVADHGFHVSFLVITTWASAAQIQFFESLTSIPPGLHVIDLPHADMSGLVTSDVDEVTRHCIIIEESLKHLGSILLGLKPKPKALVLDYFTTQAFDICKAQNIPAFVISTASTALLAFALYFPTLDREVEGEIVDLPRPIKVPGCMAQRTEDLLDPVRNRKSELYKWFLFHFSRFHLAAGILQNSWEDLETTTFEALREHPFYKSVQTPPVYGIGPLITTSGSDERNSAKHNHITEWLDNQPADSVLLVVFGSHATLSSEQLTELAFGLEMSQQRFILVARKPSGVEGATWDFIDVKRDVNDPSSYLPEGFIERTKRVGLVIPSWAPQSLILSHQSTSGFLSHCGWNSSIESLSHGVPLIGWPLYAEQRMNATMLEEEIRVAKKPISEPGKVIRRQEIERVVRLVMEGEEGKKMRDRAKELKESGIRALEPGGSSYNSLASVTDLWKSLG